MALLCDYTRIIMREPKSPHVLSVSEALMFLRSIAYVRKSFRGDLSEYQLPTLPFLLTLLAKIPCDDLIILNFSSIMSWSGATNKSDLPSSPSLSSNPPWFRDYDIDGHPFWMTHKSLSQRQALALIFCFIARELREMTKSELGVLLESRKAELENLFEERLQIIPKDVVMTCSLDDLIYLGQPPGRSVEHKHSNTSDSKHHSWADIWDRKKMWGGKEMMGSSKIRISYQSSELDGTLSHEKLLTCLSLSCSTSGVGKITKIHTSAFLDRLGLGVESSSDSSVGTTVQKQLDVVLSNFYPNDHLVSFQIFASVRSWINWIRFYSPTGQYKSSIYLSIEKYKPFISLQISYHQSKLVVV